MYASFHKLQKKLLFFRLPYLEYDLMITTLVRLNLAVLKILVPRTCPWWSAML